ncbi:MAG: cytochrome c, partial [Bacteroidetes bacterium]
MKKFFQIATAAILLAGCGEKKEEKKDGFEMSRTKNEATSEMASDGVPVDMDNKGVGPIASVTFDPEIDAELAKAGESKFQMICTACHMIGQRMIGPDLSGIYERRSPEWVMNMMLN